eukprot:TRINITY_DN773_c0_g1_i1.p2 TRINITY_DN773_c0_g1~~TRINITY_DN773_c0_g1_i1.p2  ORF type:complete len:234 (-),score=-23.92 TRINITY_DN773_c0_g1_i1:737-1438(-)
MNFFQQFRYFQVFIPNNVIQSLFMLNNRYILKYQYNNYPAYNTQSVLNVMFALFRFQFLHFQILHVIYVRIVLLLKQYCYNTLLQYIQKYMQVLVDSLVQLIYEGSFAGLKIINNVVFNNVTNIIKGSWGILLTFFNFSQFYYLHVHLHFICSILCKVLLSSMLSVVTYINHDLSIIYILCILVCWNNIKSVSKFQNFSYKHGQNSKICETKQNFHLIFLKLQINFVSIQQQV